METSNYLSKFHISNATENQSLIGEIVKWAKDDGHPLDKRQIGMIAGLLGRGKKDKVNWNWLAAQKAENVKNKVALFISKLFPKKLSSTKTVWG